MQRRLIKKRKQNVLVRMSNVYIEVLLKQ